MVDFSASHPHNFEQINALVLQPGCVSGSCHSQTGKNDAKMNLCSEPDPPGTPRPTCQNAATLRSAYDALIGVEPANTQAKNDGKKIVDPCNVDNSFLLTKLRLPTSATDPDAGYGEHMPKDAASLPPAVIEAISDWIARGAHFDEPADVTGSACANVSDLGAD